MKLFFLLSTLALAEPPPPNTCPVGYCGPAAAAFAEAFTQAKDIPHSSAPYIASGNCFHETSRLRNDITHHAYVLFEERDGRYYLGGSFSFFARQNPYSSLDIDSARERQKKLYDPKHILQIEPTYAFAEMNPGGTGPQIVRYWLKRSDNTIHLFGLWGMSHRIYCALQKHGK